MKKQNCFGAYELALALGLCLLLLLGTQGAGMQRTLAQKLIRLHVVANSDSAQDQAVKLRVRDAVLEAAQALCADAQDADQAARSLSEGLSGIEAAADAALAQAGVPYGAQAMLADAQFPERGYPSFTLPAGRYLSLTVRLGRAEGKNWWCVVYPALCTAQDPEAAAADAGLTPGQIGWIRPDGRTVIRFRLAEIFEKLRNALFG